MKLELVQKRLQEEKIDLLLLLHPDPTISYLTQTDTSHSILLVEKNSTIFLVSALDDIKKVEGCLVKPYSKTWKDELRERLSNIENLRIAINKSELNIKQFESLQKEFTGVEWNDFSDELEEFRKTKTEKEIKIMFKAAKIADTALADFVAVFRESRGSLFPTELSIALFLEKRIREQGATLSFPTIVATGANSAIPHHITGLSKLKKGLLLIDMGAKYEGYCSDMTRMFCIGEPSIEEKKDFDLLLSVQEKSIKKALELVSSGKALESLDLFAREELGEEYSSAFIHSLGHGIGVKVHEAPRVSKGSRQKILKNMPFTIEPGIYFKGKWGLRIEDTVIFDGEKIIRLTKSPKELIGL